MYSIEQRDNQLLNTQSRIRYHLTFPHATGHLLDITLEIDSPESETILSIPNWIPGSYHVRNFVSNQSDVRISNGDGADVAWEWIAKNRLRIASSGHASLVVGYRYYCNERTVRMSHVNRFHAFINPANSCMRVEGRESEIHHVMIDAPWPTISTALSPVRDGVWGALNYDILIDSPIEIGDHYTARYELHGATHEIAITGVGDFDPAWLVERTRTIVEKAVVMWGELPYDRYLFIIQLLPGEYGGLEHSRSSVNMFDSEVFNDPVKIVKLLTLLCHEYFHLWNVKRIRPRELGPFNYDAENYTEMLWLAEGVTSYYDNLMAMRCGFNTREEYLEILSNEHIGRLLDVPGRLAMSIKESSYLSWVKLYMSTPDSTNRFPSYYLKGGVIFLFLDMEIITRSDGARSLDDGMRALWERYRRDPSVGITEEEFITIVSEATGVDISERLLDWLQSTEELPVAEVVAGIGLEWVEKEQPEPTPIGNGTEPHPGLPQRFSGFQVEEAPGCMKVIRVWRDSPAERAGLAPGDELIAIDGVRVVGNKSFEASMRGARARGSIRITASSERRLYETDITFGPRRNYMLRERSELSDIERKRLEMWLGTRRVPAPM